MNGWYIILILLLLFAIIGYSASNTKDDRKHVLIQNIETNEIHQMFILTETNVYYYGYEKGEFPENHYLSKNKYKTIGAW